MACHLHRPEKPLCNYTRIKYKAQSDTTIKKAINERLPNYILHGWYVQNDFWMEPKERNTKKMG